MYSNIIVGKKLATSSDYESLIKINKYSVVGMSRPIELENPIRNSI